VQANAARTQAQEGRSKAEWLASLDLTQELKWITSQDDEHFPRAFELLNKTNQFNTTGHRWDRAELEELLQKRGLLLCSFLKDRLADNGMISVFVIKGNRIHQAVLSCRAFNYGVEFAAAHAACQHILENHDEVQAKLERTGLNASCHKFFARAGFVKQGRLWATTSPPPVPAHLNIVTGNESEAPIAMAASVR
jgi:FkbH-like protein